MDSTFVVFDFNPTLRNPRSAIFIVSSLKLLCMLEQKGKRYDFLYFFLMYYNIYRRKIMGRYDSPKN